ncbi:hypothetical protein R3P38DRAFT_3283493, partial [Favolaschia claudopus]
MPSKCAYTWAIPSRIAPSATMLENSVLRPGLRRPHTYKNSRDWARNEQERGDTRRRVFRAFFTCDATWCHYICK